MAQKSGFFTAQQNPDGTYDRAYSAEEFAYYFSKFIGNGVFISPASQLQVYQSNNLNMSVNVDVGDAYINGWWYSNTSPVNLVVRATDGVNPRTDLVVLRWDKLTREISLGILEGTPSPNAITPNLTRSEDVYELALAKIELKADTTGINNTIIKDVRSDSSVCGFVHGVIDQIDVTNLFQQFQASFDEWYNNTLNNSKNLIEDSSKKINEQLKENKENFDEWFSNIKDTLDENAAAKLFDEVTILKGTTIVSELPIGESTLIIENSKIKEDSTIDIYTDDFSVFPLKVQGEERKLTLNFEVQSKIVGVKVVIR